jgi:hypothetical protein
MIEMNHPERERLTCFRDSVRSHPRTRGESGKIITAGGIRTIGGFREGFRFYEGLMA